MKDYMITPGNCEPEPSHRPTSRSKQNSSQDDSKRPLSKKFGPLRRIEAKQSKHFRNPKTTDIYPQTPLEEKP